MLATALEETFPATAEAIAEGDHLTKPEKRAVKSVAKLLKLSYKGEN